MKHNNIIGVCIILEMTGSGTEKLNNNNKQGHVFAPAGGITND